MSEPTSVPASVTDLDDALLERLVRRGAADLAAATCRWLELVAELVRRGIWADQGASSPAAWLAWAVSMGASTAREHVRVASSLADWPELTERFRAGRISFSKVRAITRHGDPALEGLLLRYAEHADGAQLERILRGFTAARPDPDRERTPHERREVALVPRADGMAELRVVAPADVVERLWHVLSEHAWALRDELRGQARAAGEDDGTVPVEVEEVGALRVDVLVGAVEQAAGALPEDTSGADRHTVVVHVHATSGEVHGDEVPVEVRTAAGGRARSMSLAALERLACQAGAVAARHDGDGELVAMSGRTRRVPPRLRRALLARDRRCRFPGCGATRFVDAHHIRYVADGGPTRLDNLVLLCVRHHHVVHDRGVTIRHDGRGRMRFHLADGRELAPSPALAATAGALAPGASAEAPAEVAADRLQPTHHDRRIDLAACVEVLLAELALLAPPGLPALAA
ncbi:MAG: HNH endonuclease [Actinomycetes bacterium]